MNTAARDIGLFITGTDTGCGKTLVTLAVMTELKRAGLQVAGMKPVASGCDDIGGVPVNDDARRIRAACSREVPYHRINPWALNDPVSPNFAAHRQGLRIEPGPMVEAWHSLRRDAQAVIVEGIGGWRAPLEEGLDQADLVRALDLPVVLVVGLRLGCINHARLTAAAIREDGVRCAGWVASHLDPQYNSTAETLDYLGCNIDAPMIGELEYMQIGEPGDSVTMLDPGFLRELMKA